MLKQIKYDNIINININIKIKKKIKIKIKIKIKNYLNLKEFNFGSDWTLFSSFKTCKSIVFEGNKLNG